MGAELSFKSSPEVTNEIPAFVKWEKKVSLNPNYPFVLRESLTPITVLFPAEVYALPPTLATVHPKSHAHILCGSLIFILIFTL